MTPPIDPPAPTMSAVDRALVAFRSSPTEENRARLLAAQEQHGVGFYRDRADEYIERTR